MRTIKLILFSTLFSINAIVFGQTASEKIEAAKIALITERLELTPEQAEKFWPIYHEYTKEQRALRKEFQALKQDFKPENASEEENKRIIESGYKIKERMLNLDKSYSDRMQNVISTRQLMSLKKAEDDFREMLISRIKDHKQRQERTQPERQRNEQQIRQRRIN